MNIIDTLKSIVTFSDAELAPPVELMNGTGAIESYASVATEQPPLTWGWNRATWPTWDPLQGAQAYARLALIYRCVNIVAHALGTAPIRVYDEANDDEELPDHAMRQLMKRPNPLMGEARFWSHVGTRAAIAGFCVVEKERDRAGNVIGLWPLQSAWLKAKQRRDGSHDWEYRVPGIVEPFPLKAEDVIAFTWADTPNGSPYGMGPLEACLREVSLNNALIDFVKAYVERGAAPVFAMIPEPTGAVLTQQEAEGVIDAWVARRGGLKNAVRPMYMQGIKALQTIGNNLEEMAYTALRDLNELGIVQAFGIPASVAQIRVGLEHSDSRANAEVDEGKLYRQTIIPLWTRFDDGLTLGLLPEFPGSERLSLEFDTSDISALQEDRNAKAVWVNAAMNAGWMTSHEAHRELGLNVPETPDFYIRYLALQAIPAETPIPDIIAEPVATPVAPADTPTDPNAEPVASGDPAALQALHATTRSGGYGDRYARAAGSRILIDKIATTRTPSLRSFFRAQGVRLLPKVTSGLAATGPDETYDLKSVNWKDEEAQLRSVLERLYLLAGDLAYDAVNDQLQTSLDFNLANPNLKQIRGLLADRVTAITDETRDKIKDAITAGHTAGTSVDDIAADLKAMFDGWTQSRAELVARTESMSAFGYASAAGYRESGVVDRIQCFDNPNHTDHYAGAEDGLSCAQRNGHVAPLDDAELHIRSEHPRGTLAIAGVLTGEEV